MMATKAITAAGRIKAAMIFPLLLGFAGGLVSLASVADFIEPILIRHVSHFSFGHSARPKTDGTR